MLHRNSLRFLRLFLLLPILVPLNSIALAGDVPDSLTGADLREEHRARRASLAAVLPAGAVAVVPASRNVRGSNTGPAQAQDYFWLTGVEESDGFLILAAGPEPGAPHREWLFLPPREPLSESWIGPRLFPGKAAEESTGIAVTRDARELVAALEELITPGAPVLLPFFGTDAPAVREMLRPVLDARKARPMNLRDATGPLRRAKSPEERARIRRAAALTAEGFRRAIAATRPGMVEFEIQAIIEAACRAGGCDRQAYDSIVGSGPNSCILHYSRNRRIMEDGDVLLVDAGGAYRGYACDLTRTWPVGSRFTPEQAKVYDTVLRAQEAGIAAAKRGATFSDISAACDAVLKEAGLIEGRLHGPCHWVGLDVHDPNGAAPLEPGSVFVIEPGAYFPGQNFGVRIEDTFLMLEDGSLECLTASVPKRREEIEALRLASLPPAAEVEGR